MSRPRKTPPADLSAPSSADYAEAVQARDYLTRAQIADYLSVSPERVSKMAADGLIDQSGPGGTFPRDETLRALFGWMRDRLGDGKSTVATAKAEGIELDNRIKRAQLAREERSALPVTDIERAWSHIILAARQKFLRIANKVAPRIPFLKSESEIESEIQREIDEALSELSRAPEYEPDNPELKLESE